jgi:hypothetical protein
MKDLIEQHVNPASTELALILNEHGARISLTQPDWDAVLTRVRSALNHLNQGHRHYMETELLLRRARYGTFTITDEMEEEHQDDLTYLQARCDDDWQGTELWEQVYYHRLRVAVLLPQL